MPSEVSQADATLDRDDMLALQGGEPAALDRLMLRWQGPLTGFLTRMTQNAFDAEDLAQETFVRVYRHRDRFDATSKFSTWLFSIACNLARDRLRRLKHRATANIDDQPEAADHGASPSEAREAQERIHAVKTAIASLPEDLRTALVLAEYQDFSQAEIAHTLGTTVKAVESRLYRARHHLRATLKRWL